MYTGEDGENWCSTRSQATPTNLLNTDQTIDNSFGVLKSVPVTTLFLIVMFTTLML